MSDSYEIHERLENYHKETGSLSFDLGHYGGSTYYHVLHFGPRTVKDIRKIAQNLKDFLKKNLKKVDPYRSHADVREFIHESLEEFFWPEKFTGKSWNPPKLTRTAQADNFDLYDVLEPRKKHMTLPSFEYPSSKPYHQRPVRHWAYARERGESHLRARKSDGRTRNYSYDKIGGYYYASERKHICSPLEGVKGKSKLQHEKERVIGVVVEFHGYNPQITVHAGFYDPSRDCYAMHGKRWSIEKITS